MVAESEEYTQETHLEHESYPTQGGATYPANEESQQTQPSRSPPPAPAQYQYSNPPQYPPPYYPPQAGQQRFPHQAGYVPPHTVQAPPQNYQNRPNPQGYNPGPAAPGVNQNANAAPMYQGGGYAGPAPGYMVQPSPYQYGNKIGTVAWTTGLFDCMEDPTNALITACFPCFTFGQNAEIIDNGQTTCATSGVIYAVIAAFTGVPCLISCTYRTKLRNQYDLIEVPAADWITHCFCQWCALCQEHRELRNRGLDPAVGWQGNMMRNQHMQQQPQVALTPPVNQNMGGPNMAR